MNKLADEFQYFLDHQDELVPLYNGKYIVIKDGVVLGAYDDELEAVTETAKVHPLGTFLVQKCEPGSDCYTVTFHSRVSLANV